MPSFRLTYSHAGWQVIRVTYARITSDPDGVRGDLATIIAARRSQIRA